MKKAYTLSENKNGVKYITIDDSVNQTAADKEDIKRYVEAGRIIRHKSAKRSKAAAARADGLKDADIRVALKDKPEALAEYEKIKKTAGKGGGYFAAKKWYKENYQ